MRVGAVSQLWRYPVKSMQGERIAEAALDERGIPGDRCWAVRDEARGGIASARRLGALLDCTAVYPEAPKPGAPPVEILLPGGTVVRSTDPDVAAHLSRAVGAPVTLWPLQPAEDEAHYLPGQALPGDARMGVRDLFGLEADEAVPDLSGLPPALWRFVTPPGTYWDAFPVLVLSETTLATLQQITPESRFDVRRFRPNVLLALDSAAGFPEQEWVGRRLRVGDAVLEVVVGCPRCVMTTRPFADLPADRAVLRTIVREAGQNAGVYARVVQPGKVAEHDPAEIFDVDEGTNPGADLL